MSVKVSKGQYLVSKSHFFSHKKSVKVSGYFTPTNRKMMLLKGQAIVLIQEVVQVGRTKVFGICIAEGIVGVESFDEFRCGDGSRTEIVFYLLGDTFVVGGFGDTAKEGVSGIRFRANRRRGFGGSDIFGFNCAYYGRKVFAAGIDIVLTRVVVICTDINYSSFYFQTHMLRYKKHGIDGAPNSVGKRTKIPHLPMQHTDIWGTFLSLLKFCRFVGTEYAVIQIRVQNYYNFAIYARKLLFFYIIVSTIVVVGVDMDGILGYFLFVQLMSEFGVLAL